MFRGVVAASMEIIGNNAAGFAIPSLPVNGDNGLARRGGLEQCADLSRSGDRCIAADYVSIALLDKSNYI